VVDRGWNVFADIVYARILHDAHNLEQTWIQGIVTIVLPDRIFPWQEFPYEGLIDDNNLRALFSV
jgi:hypothetical protein